MVTVTARWQVKPEFLENLLNVLPQLQQASMHEEGNISYEVFRDSQDETIFILFEKYKDENALEAHRLTDHFQELVLKTIVPMLASRSVTKLIPYL